MTMIRTRIVEVYGDESGEMVEKEIGYTLMPVVPVSLTTPQEDEDGKLPEPVTAKINGFDFYIISHSWDIETVRTPIGEDAAFTDGILVLIVLRKIPVAVPKSLVVDIPKPKIIM